MFKKEDIKPSMLVELLFCDGSRELHYVAMAEDGIVFVSKEGFYSCLRTFDDNLESYNSIKITKVYGLCRYSSMSLKISTDGRELLWDRDNKVDWNKVRIDTKILVRNPYVSKSWNKEYFAKYEDGKVYAFDGGRTSWSSHGVTCWAEAKLWEGDE